ncbi:hypothetical protein ACFWY9_28240 [Amycolatopsis sp. NPDC059027]|uniref:hypothetical protein n=1 Tax=Amycolatopsis sp. NPDC059027 TaxID=3346709 RepID=UPI00366E6C93
MSANGEVLSPVAAVPVLGDVVGFLDGAARQVGLPFAFRAFLELVVAGVFAYLLLRLVTARLLPWAGEALVLPVTMLTRGALVLLLLPDLGISCLVRRFGRTPPEFVYGYGAAVVAVVEAVEDLVRRGLPKLAFTRAMRPWLLIVLLAAGFLLWNNQNCVPGKAQCVSPVQIWVASFGTPQ